MTFRVAFIGQSGGQQNNVVASALVSENENATLIQKIAEIHERDGTVDGRNTFHAYHNDGRTFPDLIEEMGATPLHESGGEVTSQIGASILDDVEFHISDLQGNKLHNAKISSHILDHEISPSDQELFKIIDDHDRVVFFVDSAHMYEDFDASSSAQAKYNEILFDCLQRTLRYNRANKNENSVIVAITQVESIIAPLIKTSRNPRLFSELINLGFENCMAYQSALWRRTFANYLGLWIENYSGLGGPGANHLLRPIIGSNQDPVCFIPVSVAGVFNNIFLNFATESNSARSERPVSVVEEGRPTPNESLNELYDEEIEPTKDEFSQCGVPFKCTNWQPLFTSELLACAIGASQIQPIISLTYREIELLNNALGGRSVTA